MLLVNGKIITSGKIARVPGIDSATFKKIVDYLDDEVDSYVQTKEWFSLRNIGGGDRYDWTGTPLEPLFKHFNEQPNTTMEKAIKKAGQLCGRILRTVIINRAETFEQKGKNRIANYRVI